MFIRITRPSFCVNVINNVHEVAGIMYTLMSKVNIFYSACHLEVVKGTNIYVITLSLTMALHRIGKE